MSLLQPGGADISASDVDSRHRLWDNAAHLKAHWYVACTSRELRPGRVRGATILGVGIAVFRRSDGTVAAVLDQCLHRGTALSAGRVDHGCLTCPYHGWRYDGDGRVVHIPTEDGATTPAEPHRRQQRAFACCEAHGLVWVYPGDGAADTADIFDMPFWGARDWVSYYMVSRFDGDVGALAQNFMDVPHTVYVHNKIFRKSPERLMRASVEFKLASVEVEYHEPEDSIGLLPWLVNPERRALVHTDKFFAPNITRCDYHWGSQSGFVITSQMTPESQRRCRVYTLISYKFPLPRVLLRAIRPLLHAYTRIVLEQDIRIMRTNRRGRDNAPGATQHNVKADLVHVGIDRLIEAYREDAPVDDQFLKKRPMDFNL